MANVQIGSRIGVTQVGPADAKLAEVTADGVNTVTVAAADVDKFYLGQSIVFRVKATGAGFGTTARTITGITSAGVITYSGADIAVVPGTHAIYDGNAQPYATSSVAKNQPQGLNGGTSAGVGFNDADFGSIQAMREALAVISGTTYTSARLDTMTENDMVFALRTERNNAGVRGY